MLPFVLGGVAVAATSHGIKKLLASEITFDKINDVVIKSIEWLDRVEPQTEALFIPNMDTSNSQEQLALLLDKLDDIKKTTAILIYNDIEALLFSTTQNPNSQTYQPCEIKWIKNKEQNTLQYTEETYQLIQRFCDILTTANNFLSKHIDEMKILSAQNKSTLQPYALSQNQIKTLYKLQTFLENVIYSPISIDTLTVSKVAKRSFNKIMLTIELFKS